tara:strand:+ start:68136 stop:68990 length:855 start_codon:yes stop_codon:yes gene_type:complete
MNELTDRYVVFDFQNTLWRSYMARPRNEEDMQTSTGYPSGHVYRFFRSVHKWKSQFGGHPVFIYEGGEKYRYELFPEYKAGRDRNREFDPKPDVVKMLKHIKCTEIIPVDSEADDGIAAWVHKYPTARHLIVSSDKDLWQLRCPNVQIVFFQSVISDQEIEEKCKKHYGTPKPASIVLAKALYGDKSDGLPSVPRLFKKHVSPLLERVRLVDDFFAEIDSLPTKTAQKLRDHEEQVRKVYEAVQLRAHCKLRRREREGNAEKLTQFLEKFECETLLPLVDAMVS